MPTEQPNVELSGDEARCLMIALSQCEVGMPAKMVISMWVRLNQISHVQPPAEQPHE